MASDPLIWQQHPEKNRHHESEFRRLVEGAIESGRALVAIRNERNEVIGSSRFHAFDEAASEVEIGWTFLARAYWGGCYNGEMKRLMLLHAFQFVGSVVLLVGPDNVRSQRAVEKFGGEREGIRTDGSGLVSVVYRIRPATLDTCFAKNNRVSLEPPRDHL